MSEMPPEPSNTPATCERLVSAWDREGYAPTIFRRCGEPADTILPNGQFVCTRCAVS